MRMVVVVLAVALAGCATPNSNHSSGDSSQPKVVNSKFDTGVTVIGSEHKQGDFSYRLVSSMNKSTGAILRGVHMTDIYGGNSWKFWSSATTDKAQNLRVSVSNRDVKSCSQYGCLHFEAITAFFENASFDAATSSGFSVRFGSNIGENKIVDVLASDIAELRSLERAAFQSR